MSNKFDISNAEKLDMPERKKAFPAEKLLSMVKIGRNDTILDLGAGTGYMTIPAAKMTEGIVYALDLEKELLKELLTRAQSQNVKNIEILDSSVEKIPLPDNNVDIEIASLILHLVDSLPDALKEMKRVLKSGGYILCFEWEKKESSIGPSLDQRISSEVMESEIKKAGLAIERFLSPIDFLYNYIIRK